MSGITRIHIQSDWDDWRTQLAHDHEDVADSIYRSAFNLAEGVSVVECTKNEAAGRYDWKEGIDVILRTDKGTRMTLQEKFLTFWQSTATFEERKTNGDLGAWYYCTAQYYFVGYTRKYWDYKRRAVFSNPLIDFQDWVLIDLAAIHREDENNRVAWTFNTNTQDNRRAQFRYIGFDNLPPSSVLSRCDGTRPTLQKSLPATLPDNLFGFASKW